jgi:hypothetical protein
MGRSTAGQAAQKGTATASDRDRITGVREINKEIWKQDNMTGYTR